MDVIIEYSNFRKEGDYLIILLIFIFVLSFIGTITESLAIGWLLVSSAVLFGYCVTIICSKTKELTDMGKWILIFSAIGLIYAIMVISGFDVKSLF